MFIFNLIFKYKKFFNFFFIFSSIIQKRVVLEKSGKYLTAKIVHHSGRVVVSASSKEFPIREQLKRFDLFLEITNCLIIGLLNSSGGVNAAISLGQILALRALESGIIQVFVDDSEEDNSLKVCLIYV
jgi:ribosomal protein L18